MAMRHFVFFLLQVLPRAADSESLQADGLCLSSLIQVDTRVQTPLQQAAAELKQLEQAAAELSSVASTEVKLPPVAGEVTLSGPLQEQLASSRNALVAYMGSACLIAGLVVVLYWGQGWLVVSRILIYLFTLSTMKLSVKHLFVDYAFNYPKFVTATHFYSGAIVAFLILSFRFRLASTSAADLCADVQGRAIESPSARLSRANVPTKREFWLMIVPIAMGFAISISANNSALLFSSAAFSEIAGATGPVFSVGLMLMMGMPFDLRLLWPTLLVVAGCSLSSSGEVHFSGLGLACCFVSILGRSLKTTLQQRLMTGESRAKFDPVTLLAWMCLPSCVLMTIWSLCVEGSAPWIMLLESSNRRSLCFWLCVSCGNACVLNLSNLFCTKDLGSVGVQLVAQTKSVLTVLGGVALFHEAVTLVEVVGFVGILIGVFVFSQMEQATKKQPS